VCDGGVDVEVGVGVVKVVSYRENVFFCLIPAGGGLFRCILDDGAVPGEILITAMGVTSFLILLLVCSHS
jgi:hypothetical protein